MSIQTCLLCVVYNRSSEPQHADREQTCPRCRLQLEHDFTAVWAMYGRAGEDEEEIADGRTRPDGGPREIIARLLPMAATPPPSSQPRVSGTRERSIPINVRLMDLLGPVRDLDVGYAYADDQIGDASIASMLHAWAARWRELAFSYQRMPGTTGDELMSWLSGVRLEIVMERDPKIGLFAWQLRSVRRTLQSLLGDTVPYPQVMWGVPCRRCDLVSTLVLDHEDPDHYRECTACGLLLTEEEYRTWLKQIVQGLRRGGPAPDGTDVAPI
jgi:hypothetical protein